MALLVTYIGGPSDGVQEWISESVLTIGRGYITHTWPRRMGGTYHGEQVSRMAIYVRDEESPAVYRFSHSEA